MRVPLGVVGIIYESRPNVTADAAVLCLKAGNAAILRGGSDSMRSSRAILAALAKGLEAAGLPEAAVQLVPTRDRAAVGLMLQGLDGNVDVIVPRGGKAWWRVCRQRPGCRYLRTSKGFATCSYTARRRSTWPRNRTERQDAPHRRLRRGRTLLVDRGGARAISSRWSRC